MTCISMVKNQKITKAKKYKLFTGNTPPNDNKPGLDPEIRSYKVNDNDTSDKEDSVTTIPSKIDLVGPL